MCALGAVCFGEPEQQLPIRGPAQCTHPAVLGWSMVLPWLGMTTVLGRMLGSPGTDDLVSPPWSSLDWDAWRETPAFGKVSVSQPLDEEGVCGHLALTISPVGVLQNRAIALLLHPFCPPAPGALEPPLLALQSSIPPFPTVVMVHVCLGAGLDAVSLMG